MNFVDIIIDFYLNPLLLQNYEERNSANQEQEEEEENEESHSNPEKKNFELQQIQSIFRQVKLEYKKQLNVLQNKTRQNIAELLHSCIPEHLLKECHGILATINSDYIFQQELDCDFLLLSQIEHKTVFDEVKLKNEDILLKEFFQQNIQQQLNQGQIKLEEALSVLEDRFQDIYNEFDSVYESSRNQLEVIFRKKIAFFKNLEKKNNYQKASLDSLKITSEHDQQLQQLREIYNEQVHLLQEKVQYIARSYQKEVEDEQQTHSQYGQSYNENNKRQEKENNNNNRTSSTCSYTKDESQNILREQNFQQSMQLQSNFQSQSQTSTQYITNTSVNKHNNNNGNSMMKQQQQQSFSDFDSNQINKTKKNNNNEAFATYLWGSGKDGRLGNGDEESHKSPFKLSFENQLVEDESISKLVQVACGYHQTLAVTKQGHVYSWGRNNKGQLGVYKNNENEKNQYKPTIIYKFIQNQITITSVCTGWQHSMALSSHGKVFTWGSGDDGQLGHGDFKNYQTPTLLEVSDGVNYLRAEQIAAGHSHSAILTDKGSLYMFGCNTDLRCMVNNKQNLPFPVEVQSQQKQLQREKIIQISLGANHSLLLNQTGNIYSAGCGTDGQLGVKLSEDMDNVVVEDMLIQQEENLSFSKSQHSSISKEYFSSFQKLKQFNKNNRALKISAGDSFSLILAEYNAVFVFGKGSYCRLGIPCNDKNENIYQPKKMDPIRNEKIKDVVCGIKHAAIITENGKAYGWGFNFYEQVGLGVNDQDVSKPTLIKNLKGVHHISLGHFHSAALIKE